MIYVSDHGMTDTSSQRLVYLDEIIGEEGVNEVVHEDGVLDSVHRNIKADQISFQLRLA